MSMWRFERPVDKKWFFHIVNSAHSEESVNTSKKTELLSVTLNNSVSLPGRPVGT